MNNKIGVFDSGIGGLTTLEEIKSILPNEDFIYYADSKNNPYGEKTDEELFKITESIVDYFIKEEVKLIVIACNTATTRCIKHLREKYEDMIFVGTEPAIKVACDNNYKNILVMATPGTIASERTHALVNENIRIDQHITLLACDGLANAIENRNDKKIDSILNKLFKKYKNEEFDAIVLGCTHYPIIKDKIQSYYKKAKLIDGNKGVAQRVKNLLIANDMLTTSSKKGHTIMINSLDK